MSTTEIKPQEKTETANQVPAKQANNDGLGLLSAMVDGDVWARLCKIAEVFMKSTIAPDPFRGNQGNCIIALQLAMRMQVDPFMLMQNMYIVNGKPGLEAKFAIAMCNVNGAFQGRIKYELSGEGDTRQCMAYAFDKDTGERVDETVTMQIAKKEGWTTKKGSKWLTIPDLMLKYRSAMWLIRTTCPEVLMGMQSTDELHDVALEVIQPASIIDDRPKSEQLADQLEEQRNGKTDQIQDGNGLTAFELFKQDMLAAQSPSRLAEIRNEAAAERQQGVLSEDEWQELDELCREQSDS